MSENLTSECGNSSFEAKLATVFDMQTIEQVLYYYITSFVIYLFIIIFI